MKYPVYRCVAALDLLQFHVVLTVGGKGGRWTSNLMHSLALLLVFYLVASAPNRL